MKLYINLLLITGASFLFASCNKQSKIEEKQQSLYREAALIENDSMTSSYKKISKYMDVIKVDAASDLAEKAQKRVDRIKAMRSNQSFSEYMIDTQRFSREVTEELENK